MQPRGAIVTCSRGGPLNHGAPALASSRGLALAPPCRWGCGRLPNGDRPYPLVAHDDGPATALAESTRCQEIGSCGARARGRRPARLSGPLWPWLGCVPRSDTGAYSGRRHILSRPESAHVGDTYLASTYTHAVRRD